MKNILILILKLILMLLWGITGFFICVWFINQFKLDLIVWQIPVAVIYCIIAYPLLYWIEEF